MFYWGTKKRDYTTGNTGFYSVFKTLLCIVTAVQSANKQEVD